METNFSRLEIKKFSKLSIRILYCQWSCIKIHFTALKFKIQCCNLLLAMQVESGIEVLTPTRFRFLLAPQWTISGFFASSAHAKNKAQCLKINQNDLIWILAPNILLEFLARKLKNNATFEKYFSTLCYLPGVKNQGLLSWNFCVQSPRRSDIEEIFYRHYCCHLRLLKRLPHPLKMLSLRPDEEDKDPAAIKNRKWMRTFHSTLGAKLVIWVWSQTFWQLFFKKCIFALLIYPL